jgi:DNA processing protein
MGLKNSRRDLSRGLLDLAVTRLPLNARQKTKICLRLKTENELFSISLDDFKSVLGDCHLKEAGAGCGGAGSETEKNGCIQSKKEQVLFDFDETERQKPELKIEKAWKSIKTAAAAAEKDAVFMRNMGTSYVSVADAAYPALLKAIHDPPAVLFYRGSPPASVFNAVAVVGTRKASPAALLWTYETVKELAEKGVAVISGLALGVDAEAHRAAVDAGGLTFAVLGSSVDEVYPASNRSLAAKIIDCGGALLSEHPPGTRPQKWHFPSRNRIIAGLCAATLVVEAGEKSGALITAGFALDENREVWAASRKPEEGGGFGDGARSLIEDGASPVFYAKDVLKEFGLSCGAKAVKPEENLRTDENAETGGRAGAAAKLARELGLEI